jgi:NADPH:quinone reductase-like Zn-dependent oxidoreductase
LSAVSGEKQVQDQFFEKRQDLAGVTGRRMMKAWVCGGYGGPEMLALVDRPKPVPKDNEVLVRICATTVSSGDMRLRSGKFPRGFNLIGRLIFGINSPRQPVLGTDFAGIVEAVGRRVTTFQPGDAVMGFPGGGMRCHAQYRTMAVTGPLAHKPANLDFGEAASLMFGGTTALHFLRKANLAAGETVLVIGASGAVGSAIVQLAKHRGATVTGVTSTGNIDMVHRLGATSVIDYTKDDFVAASTKYDIIADTVGASSFAACQPVLNENGRYLAIAGTLSDMLARSSGTKRSIAGPAAERAEDVVELARLAGSGVLRPVIDRIHDFSQLPEAHAHVETGRKRGSVVVSVSGED